MRPRPLALLLLPTGLACRGEFGLSALDADTASAPPPRRCLDFDDGTLADLGWSEARQRRMLDGALVVAVEEGDDWSALLGEDSLVLDGGGALVMRSSHDGRVHSTAQATTPAFPVESPHASWRQLSEVGAQGIALSVAVLAVDGERLAERPIPVHTGGFVPALAAAHGTIGEAPEITHDAPLPGDATRQVLDLSPWLGQDVRLRFRQHTRIARNGFFTVLDQVCLQTLAGRADVLGWEARAGVFLP
jgi:hypothetical protein